MGPYSKITPEGSRDILFEESRAQREAQARLSRIFLRRGYREVLTPGLEYYDVFSLPGAGIPQQEMYKCTDNHGRLLVFRPDSTLPIVRMTASRLQNEPRPLRLFYDQSVYRNRPDLSGRRHESAQMGVELLGAGGLRADLEVMTAAVEALSACVPDFRMEIGHARFFGALAEQLPLPAEKKEELRAAIEAKNYSALDSLLDPLEDSRAAQAMKRLPRLFGGEETLQEAEKWCCGEGMKEVLEYLKTLYAALRELGLGDRLMVDLGLVQRNDYYTGAVFSAYLEEYGNAVLMGGRYDSLCEKFGVPMPAVGFAIDVDAVSALLIDALPPEETAEVLLYGEPGFEAAAQKRAAELSAQGVRCQVSVLPTWEETVEYASRAGVRKTLRLGEKGEEEL